MDGRVCAYCRPRTTSSFFISVPLVVYVCMRASTRAETRPLVGSTNSHRHVHVACAFVNRKVEKPGQAPRLAACLSSRSQPVLSLNTALSETNDALEEPRRRIAGNRVSFSFLLSCLSLLLAFLHMFFVSHSLILSRVGEQLASQPASLTPFTVPYRIQLACLASSVII